MRKIIVKKFLEFYLDLPDREQKELLVSVLPLVYDLLTNNELRLFNKQEKAHAVAQGWEGKDWFQAFMDIRNNACQKNLTLFLNIDIVQRLWLKLIEKNDIKLLDMQIVGEDSQMDASLEASCKAVTAFFHQKLFLPLPKEWQTRFQ